MSAPSLGLLAMVGLATCGGGTPVTTVTTTPDVTPKPSPPTAPATADGAPVAEKRPHDVVSPFGTRNDPYYWLRDDTRKDPDVLAWLNAENAYRERAMRETLRLQETLFDEMKQRLQDDDTSVPVLEHGYWYYTRYAPGAQQPIFARRKGTMKAAEEILLDGPTLAEGTSFYYIGAKAVSPDGKLLAWVDDTVGRNQYTLHVKEIATGKVLPDTATGVDKTLAWANDNKTLFYAGKDPVTLREDRVMRHVLGGTTDELAFLEPDGQYYVHVGKTKSEKYVLIELEATTNSEWLLVDADRPASAPVVFLARSKDHEYELDHVGKKFYLRTNADAKNFRLVAVAEGKQSDRAAWTDVIAHDPEVLVSDFVVYQDFVAATVRQGGLEKVLVVPNKKPRYFLAADDPSYAMSVVDTPGAKTKRLRYVYDSMVTPETTFELDVATKKKTTLKQQAMAGYDPSLYASEYVHATAADGAQVPISVVYKKTTPRDGTAPLLVYGYGSYGSNTDPRVVSPAISLLDRGWVYALAHVRGGSELGRHWYEDGRLLRKKNTFTDFIAATEHLVTERYGARDQVFANGGSAGGLLVGAVANLRPDLYRGMVTRVPFVDVVTTMLDATIPLTTNEFDEWGNPGKDKAAYDYMLSYSPYDQVAATGYPSIFVQTGLWDSQVQYYEPAKWVAKLRATKTDQNLLVLDCDMTSGHGGASGRFDKLRQAARQIAFYLMIHDRPDGRTAWPK
jgi:oligopeptidase B